MQNWLLPPLVASPVNIRARCSRPLNWCRKEGKGMESSQRVYPRPGTATRNRKYFVRTHLNFARRRCSRWLRATQVAARQGSELLSVDPCGTPSWGSELRLRLKAEKETITCRALAELSMFLHFVWITPRSALQFPRTRILLVYWRSNANRITVALT